MFIQLKITIILSLLCYGIQITQATPRASNDKCKNPIKARCNTLFLIHKNPGQKYYYIKEQTIKRGLDSILAQSGERNLLELSKKWLKSKGFKTNTPLVNSALITEFSDYFLFNFFGIWKSKDYKPKHDLDNYFKRAAEPDCSSIEMLQNEYRKILSNPEGLIEVLEYTCESGVCADANDDVLRQFRKRFNDAHYPYNEKALESASYDISTFFFSKTSDRNLSAAYKKRLCTYYSKYFSKSLRFSMFDLITQLSNSKPMIDAFTTVYFTPDNYQHAEQQLVESKKFYEKFFQTKIFPNTSLSGEEMDQYIQELRTMSVMKVYHFNDSSFELDPNLGVSVLKKDVFGLDPTKDLRLPLGFSKGFYSVNAKYLPRLIEGTVTVPEQLYLYPNFLLALKDYPEYTQWLIDHETGHKFNKAVDSIRGPKLWLTFNKLLECLHTSTGTTMAQDEEMLADWLAAERTAFALNSEKNRNKKRKILDGILAIQCSRQREEERYGGHDNWDEHPSASVRNEVLLGKNPIVLKVLGCPMVPHCTLEGLTTLPPAQEGTPADKGIKPAAPPAAKLLSR